MTSLEKHTRAVRDSGRKLLVAYMTAGVTADWADHLRAAVDAGADVIEVGLPFSDPMLDGPEVQAASDRALTRGSTVDGILAEVARLGAGVPAVVMTYANLVLRHGTAAFRQAGVAGLIVPDAPLEHLADLGDDLDLVLLASPATPPARRAEIARRSRGFVYAVSLMGTTGVRAALPESAGALVRDLKAATDLPVLLGFGVATPAAAARAVTDADGVIVGSALVRGVLDGATPAQTGAFLQRLRAAVDDLADGGATGAEVRHDRRRSGAAHP